MNAFFMKRILIVQLASLILLSSCSEKPKNELPMYGGIPRNPYEQEADEEFKKNVIEEYGSREMAFNKAIILGWHWFFKKDYPQAMRRFNQAWLLDPHNPAVFHAFGMTLDEMGDGREYVKWNLKAAEMNFPKSQFNVGHAYLMGNGVKADPVEALKWFRLAAEQGLSDAENAVGLLYDWGHGVEQDPIEAAKWYERADQHGFKSGWISLRRKNFITQNPDSWQISFQQIISELNSKRRGSSNVLANHGT